MKTIRKRVASISKLPAISIRHIKLTITILFITLCAYGHKDSMMAKKTDTLFLQTKLSNDTLILKTIEQVPQNTNGFDWKIWLPTFTALIVLLVSNVVVLYKIGKDTKEAIKKEIILNRIKIERERLEKFYDPIFITLKSNGEIFKAYGPNTFPRDSGVLETEASEVWKLITQNVIIPNNNKICDTIQQYSHLIGKNDSINGYLNYFIHSESFEHFIKFPNTLHKAFKYPNEFITKVEENRNKVLKELHETENKLIKYYGSKIYCRDS
jgi:hypothetical protein